MISKIPHIGLPLSIVLVLFACNQVNTGNTKFKGGVGDMQYIIHEDHEGDIIKEGDFASIFAIEKTENDSVIYSSYEMDNRPALLSRDVAYFKGDFNTALGMLSEGDSATFKINRDSLVETGREDLKNISGKYVVFTIKIDKVIHRGLLSDSLYNIQIENFRKAERDKAKLAEPEKLKRYLSSLRSTPKVTESGLNYIIHKQGEGEPAVQGDTIIINYTAKYLSGKIFDTNYPEVAKKAGVYKPSKQYTPLLLTVEGKAESGFDQGLLLFPKGTHATLIIPSRLAYGEEGGRGVKPWTPVICEMEIVDIKRKR
ncbi:MAG TPA: FKBP-type peptidyl-prolyl cis-trans isomerase [Sphingobacteriaceae bacterium]